ncbi:unnamed protein product [Rhodiola kirilowii]
MNSSSGDPPPKRHKLPLHLRHHDDADDLTSLPQSDMLTSSGALRSTNFNFNFNQLVPTSSTPFLTPSLFSPVIPNHYETINECRSGKGGRVRDFVGDGQGLSLSLSSDRRCNSRDLDHCLVRYESSNVGHEIWRNSVPLGPFTGYASILSRSRFLKPAQDLLDELCGVDSRGAERNSFQGFCYSRVSAVDLIQSDDTDKNTCNDSSLILLLDEVFKRYKHYYQHLQSVVASFETVCGLGNAAPYISFALRTMSQQFSCLKKTIFEKAQSAEALGHRSISNVTQGRQESHQRCVNLKPVQTSAVVQHPVWQSQRGLPAYAVAVFKNWLFEHFLHPYPSDTDKNLLAQQTGLSRNQVSNWFINARVRLWKPLVEEIHTLDEQQGQQATNFDLNTSKASVLHQPPDTHPVDHQAQAVALQMSINKQCQDRFNQSCPKTSTDRLSNHPIRQGGMDENISISLALGLQQNNGLGSVAPQGDVNM